MLRAAAVLLAIVAAGCSGFPGGTDPGAARGRAQRMLDRWADAVAAAGAGSSVTPVGDLTGQIGDWEGDLGDNNKRALMAGLVAATDGLSDVRPADGRVTWADGTTATVALTSPSDAIASIAATADACDDCVGLLVTDARLTSGPIQTTRGPATGPIWELSLAGTHVKLTRIAVARTITVPPLFDADPGIGLAIDDAEGSVTGSEVTVAFVGAPDAGDRSCGEDYTAEAVESDLAIVVIVTRHPHLDLFGGGCSAVGARRTATATLSAPLGERAVLDLQQGTPVPIDLRP